MGALRKKRNKNDGAWRHFFKEQKLLHTDSGRDWHRTYHGPINKSYILKLDGDFLGVTIGNNSTFSAYYKVAGTMAHVVVKQSSALP